MSSRLALAAVLTLASGAVEQSTYVILIAGEGSASSRRGVEMALDEMRQTARLLDAVVRIARGPEPISGVVALRALTAEVPNDVPVVFGNGQPAANARCHFAVRPSVSTREPGVLWHPSLTRYGAEQLNDRFERRYSTPMDEDAWAGWIAVKALVEALLRSPDPASRCETLAQLRFDGHKGKPLFFDPATRTLSQPLYQVKDGRVVSETK